MKVLVTSARSPVSLEWTKIIRKSGYQVLLCDSLHFPLANFMIDKGVSYYKIPGPKTDFEAYSKAIKRLINLVDLVIPTCEDIFYLAQLQLNFEEQEKCWMANSNLLLQLHHKYQVYQTLPIDSKIQIPQTRLLRSSKDIDERNLANYVFKPVYSRFGNQVIQEPTAEKIARLEVTKQTPWVQQEKISGQALCNYAVCWKGKVISHILYRPRYLLNQSASTYFEYTEDKRIEKFIYDFVKLHQFHGQIAFDFIENDNGIFLIECNPRGTSGLHLMSSNLIFKHNGPVMIASPKKVSFSIGYLLFCQFGWRALRAGKLSELWRDYKRSQSIFTGLPFYALGFSLLEMVFTALKYKISLTAASTYDMEYNGSISIAENENEEF